MRIALLSLVLLMSSALAGPPAPRTGGLAIEGETLTVVTRVPFDIVGPPGAKLYYWSLPAGWKGNVGKVSKNHRVTVVVAPEGTATVNLTTVDKDFELAEYSLEVSVGKAGPKPPDPSPTPPVPPGPVGKAWVVVVEETSEAQAGRGALYADKALVDLIKARGWKLRVTDKDARDAAGNPPRDLAPYLALARTKPLPWLWVVSDRGRVLADQALPTKAADLVGLLRKVGGE